MTLTRADVAAAAGRIAGHVHATPVYGSRALDARLDARLRFKCENLQRTGSFKVRGATNAVRRLPGEVAVVATHSSGNHGAALALAAQESGRRAIVVVPADVRPAKRAAIERRGGEVVVCAPSLDARGAALEEVLARTGATFVPPYDHDDIIAGAGTAALELLAEQPELDEIWVPVGGGGLAAGTVVAAAGEVPVVLAEPALAGDAKRSLESGVRQPPMPPKTIADGLRTGLGERNFTILRAAGSRVRLASESGIETWARELAARLDVPVEPSAAVTVAAMAEQGLAFRGAAIGVILTGGNL